MREVILSSISTIDDTVIESDLSVINSLLESYEKALIVLENYNGDAIRSFNIFQEGMFVESDDTTSDSTAKIGIFTKIWNTIKSWFDKFCSWVSGIFNKSNDDAAIENLSNIQEEEKDKLNLIDSFIEKAKTDPNCKKKLFAILGAAGATALIGGGAAIAAKKINDHKKSTTDTSIDTSSEEQEPEVAPQDLQDRIKLVYEKKRLTKLNEKYGDTINELQTSGISTDTLLTNIDLTNSKRFLNMLVLVLKMLNSTIDKKVFLVNQSKEYKTLFDAPVTAVKKLEEVIMQDPPILPNHKFHKISILEYNNFIRYYKPYNDLIKENFNTINLDEIMTNVLNELKKHQNSSENVIASDTVTSTYKDIERKIVQDTQILIDATKKFQQIYGTISTQLIECHKMLRANSEYVDLLKRINSMMDETTIDEIRKLMNMNEEQGGV